MHITQNKDCKAHRLKTEHNTDWKLHITLNKNCTDIKQRTAHKEPLQSWCADVGRAILFLSLTTQPTRDCHIYIYIYMCVHIYIYTYKYLHVKTHTCLYVYIYNISELQNCQGKTVIIVPVVSINKYYYVHNSE